MNGRALPLLLVIASALGLGGCAHERPSAIYPYPSASSVGWVVPSSYSWPPKTTSSVGGAPRPSTAAQNAVATLTPSPNKADAALAPTSVFARTLGDVPRPRTRNELRSVLPGSTECVARLSDTGVRFHPLEREMGVKTPIVVDGPIAGVRYYTGGNGPLIADCRLVLALSKMSPDLSAFGVSDVRFSGAYVFRLSNKRRVSLHAYGLALDMHGFTRLGVSYEVKRDFRKGLGFDLNDSDAPIVNLIATRFKNSGLFHEYLTPDDNADHHDHVHVGVSPLPDEVQ